jgi:CDP-diacylglycerol--glycerol-3-phosphate 3-phosphatidyltransferase/cardiolipin synthase
MPVIGMMPRFIPTFTKTWNIMALAIPAAVIIGREITISALREWMAELGARAAVAVSLIGKFKTAVQMVAILLLVYDEPLVGIPVFTVGFVLLYVAALLTLWSMVLYLRAAWPSLLGESARNIPQNGRIEQNKP